MRRILLLLLIIIVFSDAFAQEKQRFYPEIKASLNSFISSGEDLPFWITSNQNGVFSIKDNSYQIMQLGFERDLRKDTLKKWGFTYGANLVYGYADKTSDFQFNQYWLGFRYKGVILKSGAQAEPILYSGLSSTNGNMDLSNNARPLPGISLATNGFVPFWFLKKKFSVKALYSENILLDNQYVERAHLHHKYAIGRYSNGKIKITMGIDHWVYWGGISPDIGRLPGFGKYLNYILALKGGLESPNNERRNALGNTLGLYLFSVEKEYNSYKLTLYYNHPFEDRSGLEMDNIQDGLWGLYYTRLTKKVFLSAVVYEFQNTTNQSGTYNMVPIGNTGRFTGRGNDDYFNNWIYKSGHVHYNRMSGSPFFVPVIGADGISTGFDNNRIWVHHIGLSGWCNDRLSWKSLFSWSRGFGTYDKERIVFLSHVDQFSFLTDCGLLMKKIPLRLNIGIAGDLGEVFEKRIGAYAGLSWSLK